MDNEPSRISSCPRCGKSIRATPGNIWRPFCSERCKSVDLGAWFSEQHRIPGANLSEDGEENPPESQKESQKERPEDN